MWCMQHAIQVVAAYLAHMKQLHVLYGGAAGGEQAAFEAAGCVAVPMLKSDAPEMPQNLPLICMKEHAAVDYCDDP